MEAMFPLDDDVLFSRAVAPVFAVSDEIADLARKNEAGILHRVHSLKGAGVARRLNTSEATVSRMAEWEFRRMAQILAAAGLKAVSIDMRCLPKDQMDAILAIARSLEKTQSVEQLTFED